MKFNISPHAQYRYYERGISTEAIKTTIREPDNETFQTNGKIKAEKLIDEKKLIVIYLKDGKEFVIITVYYENNLRQ